MECSRCGGYMEEVSCYGDMRGSRMLRCMSCGERVDELVLKNRSNPLPRRGAEPLMAGSRNFIERRHECICGCGVMVKGVYATRECRKKAAMVSVEGRCVVSAQATSGSEFASDFHISENVVDLSEIKI